MVIRIDYRYPGVWLDLWGGTSDAFNGLAPFKRVIDRRWQNNITGMSADIDGYQYAGLRGGPTPRTCYY